MRFTVFAAMAACQCMASRPDFRRASSSSAAVRLGDLVLQASKGGDRLGALRKASAQMSSLIAESGSGDISEEDAALFREVIVVVEQNLFGSLDDAHDADVAALNAAVQACSSCNADIARRQTRGGDLYDLQMTAEASQAELDRLQLEVDAATTLNSTTYAKLINLVQLISPPPACPEFPSPRTLSSVDVYFEQSDYVIWYTAQQSAYQQSRAVWEAADAALVAANQAYAVQFAIRDVHYCDYRSELVAGCNIFNECYMNGEAHYQQLVPMVETYEENRIDCYKAGVTIIYQINFLLGEVETQETPSIDTSRYEIDYPKLPDQGLCDLAPLDSDEWVPPVDCGYLALDVPTAWDNHFVAFGEQDLDRIMLDYHEGSVLQIFNDACDANGGGVLSEFVGLEAIRGFFADLFTTLTPTPGINLPPFSYQGTDYPNPTVEDGTVSGGVTRYDAANVFLVWQSVPQGILQATDTFTWENTQRGVQIEKQNIVATEPQACPAMPPANAEAPVADAGSPITLGWNNHFNAFGAQDRKAILADYTDSSDIQVYSWGGRDQPGYSRFRGLAEIGDMFDSLWADINSQTFEGSNGLSVPQGFPRIELDFESVFLTWSSYSNPKATDTFLFDAEGKILRQTIVTTTGVVPAHQLLDGCSRTSNQYAQYGQPRLELDVRVAGEAVCCNENGRASRRFNGECTSTSRRGVSRNVDPPSHTFFEAQAVCEARGLRLCRSQQELDTGCGTGCNFDAVLVWIA